MTLWFMKGKHDNKPAKTQARSSQTAWQTLPYPRHVAPYDIYIHGLFSPITIHDPRTNDEISCLRRHSALLCLIYDTFIFLILLFCLSVLLISNAMAFGAAFTRLGSRNAYHPHSLHRTDIYLSSRFIFSHLLTALFIFFSMRRWRFGWF